MATKTADKSVALRAASTRTLRLGLLNVRVGTGPSSDVSAREAAKLIDPQLKTPLKQVYLNDNGEAVAFADRARGYERNGGYVILAPDEKPDEVDSDGSIELTAQIDEVAPELVTQTALVWPADKGNDVSYALIARHLAESGRALVGTTVMSGTTRVVAVRWSTAWECMVMHTLVYDAQVRHANIAAIVRGTAGIEVDDRMASMAEALFGTLPTYFDFATVRDEYGERLTAAIDAKVAGTPISKPSAEPEAERPDDLMAALEASLAAIGK